MLVPIQLLLCFDSFHCGLIFKDLMHHLWTLVTTEVGSLAFSRQASVTSWQAVVFFAVPSFLLNRHHLGLKLFHDDYQAFHYWFRHLFHFCKLMITMIQCSYDSIESFSVNLLVSFKTQVTLSSNLDLIFPQLFEQTTNLSSKEYLSIKITVKGKHHSAKASKIFSKLWIEVTSMCRLCW